MRASGTESARFAALDSLRGVCALMVVLFHFNFQGEGMIAAVHAVQKGWLFVDFFFVLSGFVLAHAYWGRVGRKVSPWRFLALRIGRIYPLHIAVLAAMVTLELALLAFGGALGDRQPFSGDRDGLGLIASVLLLHSSNITDGLVWNAPSWSIAAEFWAYVLFALVALSGRLWLFVPAALLALATLLLTQPDLHFVTDRFGTIRCVYGFSLGVLLWGFVRRRPLSPAFATCLELAIVAAIWAFATYVWKDWPTLLGPPLFAVAVWVFQAQAGLVSRMLTTRPFLGLGTLSYSIYMVHPFVQARLMEALAWFGWAATGAPDRLTVTGAWADAIMLVMVLAVIAVAMLSYRWIERPARDWSRRRLRAPAAERTAPTF